MGELPYIVRFGRCAEDRYVVIEGKWRRAADLHRCARVEPLRHGLQLQAPGRLAELDRSDASHADEKQRHSARTGGQFAHCLGLRVLRVIRREATGGV